MAKTHGMKKTKEWKTWSSMRERCLNETHKHFHNYGGRGIDICKRWDKFEAFYEDMGPRPSDLHSLDRRNNNQGYSPENCFWATKREQGNNRRTNIRVLFNGEENTITEWARILKMRPALINQRLKKDWPLDMVLSNSKFWGGRKFKAEGWKAKRGLLAINNN